MRVDLCYRTKDLENGKFYVKRDIQTVREAKEFFNKIDNDKITYAYLRHFKNLRFNVVKILKEVK